MSDERLKQTLSGHTNPTLRYAIYEAVAWAIMVGAGESYISAFGILLQATPLQVGMLAALPPLINALAQLLGVWLMNRLHARRSILTKTVAIQACMWLPIAALGLLFEPGAATVQLLILLVAGYFTFAGIMAPVWNSLIGDVVPADMRGRYFGKRSRTCNVFLFGALLGAGQILHIFEKLNNPLAGFIIIFLFAGTVRLTAVFWFKRHDDPPWTQQKSDHFSFLQFLRRAWSSNFGRFVFFAATVNFAVNFAGPYFSLYMLKELKLSYLQYTVLSASAVITQVITLQHWGELSDRFGNKKIMNVCAYGISFVSMLWLFGTSFWWLLFAQLYSGFVWAGFNLSVSNFLFDAVSPAKRARCVAYQSIVNGSFTLAGSMCGGLFASYVPVYFPAVAGSGIFLLLFMLSGLMRLLAAATFLRLFKEVREVERIHHKTLLFRIVSLRPFTGATFGPLGKRVEGQR